MKIQDFIKKKQAHQKITMVTCYDFPSACTVAESNIDCVLVGDSVAMAVHGHQSTLMANIEMMALHTEAVARGLSKQFLITDLPFLSHKMSMPQTIKQVTKLMQAGAHAIKIEGAAQDTCDTIEFLVQSGIPIMGHLGLTPQFIHQLGGYKVQGKTQKQAEILLNQALKLEEAGCFAIVLECVSQPVAKFVTQHLSIPTIGIGSGEHTDGQVLVWHDLLGLQNTFNPKFVKTYAQGKQVFIDALNLYVEQVQNMQFPNENYAFEMED